MNFSKIKVGDTFSYVMRGTNDDGENVALEVKATITSVEPVSYVEENKEAQAIYEEFLRRVKEDN